MIISLELIEVLRYRLCMFEVPIDGPRSAFCDNDLVYTYAALPQSSLNKNHRSIAYHRGREAVAAQRIHVFKKGTLGNLAYLFSMAMTGARRKFLLLKFTYQKQVNFF